MALQMCEGFRSRFVCDEEFVFGRVCRGDGRRTRSPDGSRGSGGAAGGAGLGLPIARWIVVLHGGAIRAERREPHGSHMVVTLPAART